MTKIFEVDIFNESHGTDVLIIRAENVDKAVNFANKWLSTRERFYNVSSVTAEDVLTLSEEEGVITEVAYVE